MKVSDLIEELQKFPQDLEVYHSSDEEGNRIRPFSDVGTSWGEKETDRYGEISLCAQEDLEDKDEGLNPDDYHTVVVLWPV